MNAHKYPVKVLRALAHPVRLQILAALARQPACVGELKTVTRRRQAYVSQQLAVLRAAGLVACEKQDLQVCYRLTWPEVDRLLEVVHLVSARRSERDALHQTQTGERKMRNNNVPENALFVCFGGMSNVGTLTGLAGLEAVRQLEPGKAGIFCLGGLPTQSQSVLDKTHAAQRIITVDGCQLNCARKIVEQAGFTPYKTINLVEDCGIRKGPPFTHTEEDLRAAVQTILDAVRDGQ
jgi:uncharacterized metal-binding protein/DNA-binding transcriptional ArsR family regulator